MKSVRLFIFLCIAILSVTCMSGCNVGTAEVTEYSFSETTDNHEGSDLSREVFAEAEWTGWNLEQFIQNSTNVFLGKCSYQETGSGPSGTNTVNLRFSIEENLKGIIDTEVKSFRAIPDISYQEGCEYLVFCGRDASVFSGQDIYGISAVVWENNGILIHEGIYNFPEAQNLRGVVDIVRKHVSDFPDDNENAVNNDYCRSDDLQKVYEFSDCVMTLEVTDIFENQEDRTSYFFKPISIIKGQYYNEEWLITLKDAMKTGEKYLVFLTKPAQGSRYFIISSRNSVFELDSEKALSFLENVK